METSKLVKQGMDESRTQATGEVGEAITEQYVGPSAARIANLIPHRVSFEQGLVPDDDGHLSRRNVGRAGVPAAA